MTLKSSKNLFHDACYNMFTQRPPIWFMRQAGRYLPEYRAIRQHHTFLEMIHNTDLIHEVTMQPIKRFDFDAAILYSDILVIPQFFGLHFDFIEGKGPCLRENNLTPEDLLSHLNRPWELECTEPIYDAVDTLSEELASLNKTLIGFAGSPFTVACYLIEKGSSKTFSNVHRMIQMEPDLLHQLLDKITKATIYHVQQQAKRGADIIQIFDTWGSLLTPSQYNTFSRPYLTKIFDALLPFESPLTLFVKNTAAYLDLLHEIPFNTLGVDWQDSISDIKQKMPHLCVQGNLNPNTLNLSKEKALEETKNICLSMQKQDGFIFNLGHGILPQTPLENVHAVVDYVKSFRNIQT
ncbi:uroporphyrinogen decarboxylase [bacterium]|nr:uroporphyrinogen decarboxylase [bacterium]